MWDATCHLCDHVLPDTAMRQWVLTAPYEVRRVMALRPDALTACHRLFVTEIARWQKASSALAGAQTGTVTFVQRFHSALGSGVMLDDPAGFFCADSGGLRSADRQALEGSLVVRSVAPVRAYALDARLGARGRLQLTFEETVTQSTYGPQRSCR